MKRIKRTGIVSMFFLLAIVISGCSSTSTVIDEDEVRVRFATYVPVTSPVYKYVAEPWMERVVELTNGKVEFNTFPGEQLGKAHDMLKLTRDGVIDIGLFPANYFPEYMPITSALTGFPSLNTSSYQGTMAYNELLKSDDELIQRDFVNNRMVPLMGHVSPTYDVWAIDKEIRVPGDLRGIKIRTAGGITNEYFSHFSAVPVTISHTETYEALEKGIIDAANYSSVGVEASGTKDLLGHATFPHIGTAIHSLVVNERIWNRLPEDVQQAMKQAVEDILEESGVNYDEETIRFNELFEKEGGDIIELTGEEQQQWDEAATDFIETWIDNNDDKGVPYQEVLDHYRDLLDKVQ
ncbi:TRAP transporter substrate-binding protein DctP [Cytobacillus purgationiresistens]|uniref:TRAP-type C4-dicarboxylate transport system substrate-binding protein n=1 Tax=Cytobacillus purgationiresistens TaxID=863449 RepID=A0ABU0AQG1_9BACI|nr:TRAP transporter substrate-binding protein DctP [Cytobacillus purgationiresistens]MDQ0273443.1 TRAP-type C4-dicarboxylate transport system substrate-binding protein [Cytobacillus purgationiresistens]